MACFLVTLLGGMALFVVVCAFIHYEQENGSRNERSSNWGCDCKPHSGGSSKRYGVNRYGEIFEKED